MENSLFIGIGQNPDGPDLPLGLGMKLAQDPQAMNAFGRMTNAQKSAMIGYIQGASTGDDAKERMVNALEKLRNNQLLF